MAGENGGTGKKYPYDELRYGLVNLNSLSVEEKIGYGKKAMRRQTILAAVMGVILVAIGIAFIVAIASNPESENYWFGIGIGIFIAAVGLIAWLVMTIQTRRNGALALAGEGVDRANKKLLRGHSILSKRMQAEMEDPARPIYEEFYREWQTLRGWGVYPQTFVNGWRFMGCQPVDILVDEADGRVAVCSYYTADILCVIDASKIFGCELQNDGAVMYRTTVNDGAFVNTGAVPNAYRYTKSRPAQRYKLVVLCDDINAGEISFEFDAKRNLAESAFRTFDILVNRNGRSAGRANGDIFRDL